VEEFSLSEWLSGLFSESADASQQVFRDAGIILLSLLLGLVLSTILAGSRLGHRIDLLFSSPRKEEAGEFEAGRSEGFRPVRIFGWLVVLSFGAAGVWIVTALHRMNIGPEYAWPILQAAWKIAAVALVATLAARALARRVLAVIEHPPMSETLDRILPTEGKKGRAFSGIVGDTLAILIYAGVSIMGTAVALDMLSLPVGRSLLRLTASATILFGTTILLFVMVAFRDPIAEIGASVYLKIRKIDWVIVDGRRTKISQRGPFSSKCEQGTETIHMSNRALMSAALGGGQGKVGTTPTENASTAVEEDPSI
jgi:hypothetical protein